MEMVSIKRVVVAFKIPKAIRKVSALVEEVVGLATVPQSVEVEI